VSFLVRDGNSDRISHGLTPPVAVNSLLDDAADPGGVCFTCRSPASGFTETFTLYVFICDEFITLLTGL
jgi:hypothetical protein